MKLLFAIVIYKGVELFFKKCMMSLCNQEDDQFDLLVLNDGCKVCDFTEAGKKFALQLVDVSESGLTPAQIRGKAFEFALQHGYEGIVFGDADDYFSENRISVVKKYLPFCDFIFNEISTCDVNGRLIEERVLAHLGVGEKVSRLDELLDCNVVGMSNSAFNLLQIGNIELPFPKDVRAADWWVASLLLLNGMVGLFEAGAVTYYRQSVHNFTGMRGQLGVDKLFLGVSVKKAHYAGLVDYLKNRDDNRVKILENRLESICQLEKKLSDTSFVEKYLNIVNAHHSTLYKGWWSDIIGLEDMERYEVLS